MKKILISICLIFLVGFCFAIPGVNNIYGTLSGEYVFYRDYTFAQETYIGFLYLDFFIIWMASGSMETPMLAPTSTKSVD